MALFNVEDSSASKASSLRDFTVILISSIVYWQLLFYHMPRDICGVFRLDQFRFDVYIIS